MTRAADLAKLIAGSSTLGGTGELVLKDVDTADGSSPKITFQTGDTDIAADDVLGTIDFQAPDESTGTDAILVAAGIEAVSEGDFSSSSNATSLVFKTGSSEAASKKVKIDSAGGFGIGDTATTFGKKLSVVDTGATGGTPSVVANYTNNANSDFAIRIGNTLTSIGTGANAPLVITTNDTEHMRIDTNGHVTKPLQPAFSATPLTGASAQSNLSTGSDVTIVLGNEIYDVNGDFTSNTFTAPVTGKYHLSANIALNHLDMDASSCRIEIKTSNRSYTNNIDPDAFNEDADIITLSLTVVADMDASDTAIVIYYQDGGSAQTDVMKAETSFSGCLLA